ncbi:MAG: hypothetical protein GY865_12450 [candidate division Zixibacteria bacterium]|nr:hypothetical protein [candidate division Zixibacteria bacterium]
MTVKKKFNILYTNIGRGHPFYLDGICDEISRNHSDKIDLNIINVFDLSSGLSLWLWELIQFMYKRGSQGGLEGIFYSILRKYKKTSDFGYIEKILARGIRDYIKKNNHPTLVAHPMLIPMISDLTDVFYQHGELVVPDAVVVNDVTSIFVPSDNAKDKFLNKGINEKNIITTGLCIEKKLKENAEKYYDQRLVRLKAKDDLIGAFFSSGAEPIVHINIIVKMLTSMDKSGHKAILFFKSGGNIEKIVMKIFEPAKINTESAINDVSAIFKNKNILMIKYYGREGENQIVEHLFEHFDYFVAPSHERTNWALGLGIPMFILHPLIGPFSPLNRDLLIKNNVANEAQSIEKALYFSTKLKQLSENGYLVSMAQNGFGKYSLDGFSQICESIEKSLYHV